MQDVLFGSLLAVVILYGPRLFNQDGDLGRHLTVGRYILEAGKIPLSDIFSNSMQGAQLVPHEWFSQVLLAQAYQLMGLDGDVFLAGLVIASTFLLAYLETVRRGTSRLVSLAVVLMAAAASSLHWLARPHIFTFLFIAIWTFQLEKICNKQSRSLWVFPVLMLVWVNTHGAFITGFVVLGAYIAGWLVELQQGLALRETGKQLALIAATSLPVTFINPAGWHIWVNSLGFVGNDYLVSHTVEYMAPDFHHPVTWPFLFLVGFAISALAWGRRLRVRDALLLAGWAVMGLYSARNIPLFAIVTAPILGELVNPQAGKLEWLVKLEAGLGLVEKQLRGFFWPAFTVLAALLLVSQHLPFDLTRQGNTFDPDVFPVQAADWLDKHPQQGKMFNYFTWGGYLLYREWPEQKVFIDGQTDFYGEGLTREYETVISISPGWQDVLRKYDISWAIIPVSSQLHARLDDDGWHELYGDSTAVILRPP
jgi:hypothetical protein